MEYFRENILPKIENHYVITFSIFSEKEIIGLGDLERVEIEGSNLLGGVEFWSLGWMSIHLVNMENDQEILNTLISADEDNRKIEELYKLEEILIKFLK